MTSDPAALAKALGPRVTIRRYLAQIAAQHRRAGLVPMNGRWVSLDTRTAKLDGVGAASRKILAEIVALFLLMTGTALLLLLITCYLAY